MCGSQRYNSSTSSPSRRYDFSKVS
ncbi:hypothetical protein HID58_054192 [Brassica napus]|uniref:Uncharacterized protein n=1 Tax=Brassica napus TaxID=3708 RepID=A0ABQ8AH57_BRANA|nr:hypothetical protein HID58_054192 [Brassica napus]